MWFWGQVRHGILHRCAVWFFSVCTGVGHVPSEVVGSSIPWNFWVPLKLCPYTMTASKVCIMMKLCERNIFFAVSTMCLPGCGQKFLWRECWCTFCFGSYLSFINWFFKHCKWYWVLIVYLSFYAWRHRQSSCCDPEPSLHLSICPFVSHMLVLYWNGCTYQNFYHHLIWVI